MIAIVPPSARNDNISFVYGWLAEIFLKRTSAEWIDLLDAADVPVMTMHTLETVLADPHLADVGFFSALEHPTEGRTVTMSNPVQMSETPVEIARLAPPARRAHSRGASQLGVPSDRIASLLERGIAGGISNR